MNLFEHLHRASLTIAGRYRINETGTSYVNLIKNIRCQYIGKEDWFLLLHLKVHGEVQEFPCATTLKDEPVSP